MRVMKRIGVGVLMGLMVLVGVVTAQEPALNIQAPATAPVLETTPIESAPVPEAKEVEPNVKPVEVVTNAPVHHSAPVAVHGVTNQTVHAATNAHVAPVAVMPTNAVTEPVLIPEAEEFFVDTWKKPSFQIGTRVQQVKLQDTTRGEPYNGSFVGSITEITEDQDSTPDKIYLQARLPKTPLWVGVGYDHVRAQTMDDSNGDGIPDTNGGDGFVDISGFIPYLQAAWDNETRFTPFVEIGYAFYECKFDAYENWSNGGQKEMVLDSTTGFELAAGVGIRLYRNLSADIYFRQMKVDDITGVYKMNGQDRDDIVYTMSYTSVGAGLNCRF